MRARALDRLRINTCGRMTCPRDWKWDTSPGLADFDLVTIHGGRGEYRCAGAVIEAAAGCCMLFRRGDRVVGSMDPDSPMTVTWVHFDFLDAAGRVAAPEEDCLPGLARVLENVAFFSAILERVRAGWLAGDGAAAGLWLRAALAELVGQEPRPAWSGGQADQARAVREICEEIRIAPGERWRLKDMAGRLYCSPDHFGRLFRKYAGCSPGEYVIRARTEAARGLLRSSSYSVTRIADLLGYSDVYAFSRQFRKKAGVTPTAYRRGPAVR